MLRKIRLYGSLAKFVGVRVLEADVSTAAEAVRFLVTNFAGLEQHMADKHYKVITHTAITLDELHDITNVDIIKIVPAVEGSGPVGRILAGIGLVVLSFFVPFAAPLLLGIGASLVLGGVAQLLTPVPRLGQGEGSMMDTKRSYNFSGIQQTSRAGTPVPLVYGKTLVGSVVISAGISDEVPATLVTPFMPTDYAYWRAVRDETVTGWLSTATSKPQWATPFNGPPWYVRPATQDWFGGATVYGNYGGMVASMDIVSTADDTVLGSIYDTVLGSIYTWYGVVTEAGYDIGTPFTFEFSNDAVTVLDTWAGRADATPY